MSDQHIILQITSHHAPACGTPPRIEEQPGQYLGYFESEFGEQMIFEFDRSSGTGRLYAGDAGWETPYEVVDGVAPELVMRSEERLWLQACWEAATGGTGCKSWSSAFSGGKRSLDKSVVLGYNRSTSDIRQKTMTETSRQR